MKNLFFDPRHAASSDQSSEPNTEAVARQRLSISAHGPGAGCGVGSRWRTREVVLDVDAPWSRFTPRTNKARRPLQGWVRVPPDAVVPTDVAPLRERHLDGAGPRVRQLHDHLMARRAARWSPRRHAGGRFIDPGRCSPDAPRALRSLLRQRTHPYDLRPNGAPTITDDNEPSDECDVLLTPSEGGEALWSGPEDRHPLGRAGKLHAIRTLGGHRGLRASEVSPVPGRRAR